jgi:ribosome recycling factor
MTIHKGKTGIIHGVEVKARNRTQEPTVKITTTTEEGRKAVLRAAQSVYEQHHAVIQALANR